MAGTGTFSAHLIQRYENAHRPSAYHTQPIDEPVIAGAMSFNPHAHGAGPSIPPFLQPTLDPNQSHVSQSGWMNQSYNHSFASASGGSDVSEATALKIAELQVKLDRKLGPEYISTRPGGNGTKLTYAEGWKIINLANEVFGFNGWSSSIVSLTVDYTDFSEDGRRWNVGVTCVMRVTLRDGAFHEDVGYGMLENSKSKGAALDKCKKEAVTDGVKRALRNFGNLLGNCLYDKTYVKEISKVPVPTAKFDRSTLHRHPEVDPANRPVTNASATMMAAAKEQPRAQPQAGPSKTSAPNMAPPQHQHHQQNQPRQQHAQPQPNPQHQPPPAPVPAKRPSAPPLPSVVQKATAPPALAPAARAMQRELSDDELYTFASQDDALYEQLDLAELEGMRAGGTGNAGGGGVTPGVGTSAMDVDIEGEADLGQPIWGETDDEGSVIGAGGMEGGGVSRSGSMRTAGAGGHGAAKPVSAPARTAAVRPPEVSSGGSRAAPSTMTGRGLQQSDEAKARRLRLMEAALAQSQDPQKSDDPGNSSDAGVAGPRPPGGSGSKSGPTAAGGQGYGQRLASVGPTLETSTPARSKAPSAGVFNFPPGVDLDSIRSRGPPFLNSTPGSTAHNAGVKRPLEHSSHAPGGARRPLAELDVGEGGDIKRARR